MIPLPDPRKIFAGPLRKTGPPDVGGPITTFHHPGPDLSARIEFEKLTMRMPLGRIGLPAALMAGVIALSGPARDAAADPLASPTLYDSVGFLNNGQNDPVTTGISFNGTTGTLATGSSFHLGDFSISPVAVGPTTTTIDVPFTIVLDLPEATTITPNGTIFDGIYAGQTHDMASLLIGGHLVGAITPSGLASLTATFETVQVGGIIQSIPQDIYTYSFPVPASSLILPQMLSFTGSAVDGATISVFAHFAPNVPEPTASAVLLAGLVAAAARRLRRRTNADK